MNITREHEVYENDTPPDTYKPLTYAYDLLNCDEAMMLEKESKRLAGKGIDFVWHVWDTRGKRERTLVGVDKRSSKQSVWGEIWTKKN